MKICNSCAMPMKSPEAYGKNKDGQANTDYCIHCYPQGAFNTPNETIEQMIQSCTPHMAKVKGIGEDQAKAYLEATLKNLKRWKK